jgi:hypothetical protein
MTRKVGIFMAVFAMLATVAGTALAGSVKFHSGPDVEFGTPTNGATATFNVSGLGNLLATAQLDLVGSVQTFCTNPGNGNVVPGQNPATTSGSSGPITLSDSDKNGRDDVVISAALVTPATPSPQAAGCPNKKWVVTLGALTLTSATLTITYDGVIEFQQTYYP